jgi:metallo-beta-lactamase family protein
MAASGMNIYRYYASEHDLSEGLKARADFQFNADRVRVTHSVAESKLVNKMMGPGVIISSSGMMTGGRILHHLRQRLPEEQNTIVLGGFMAEGTRGRALQEGAATLRIFGGDVPVRAKVVEISQLSAHAGHAELRRWLEPLARPRQAFFTHGELASARSLADELRRERGWNTVVPKMGQSFELEHGP